MQISRYKELKLKIKLPINPNEIERNPKPAINKLEFFFLRPRTKKFIAISIVVPRNAIKREMKNSKGNLKTKIFVIIIVIILILLSIYFLFISVKKEKRFYTMEEIFLEWDPLEYENYELKKFKVGDIIHFRDIITGKILFNSTYGLITGLCFNDDLNVRIIFYGDRYDEFEIGDEYKQDFHFNYWYYNGIKYLWIDELMPGLFITISIVIQGASYVGGIIFTPDFNLSDDGFKLNFDYNVPSFKYSLMNLSI